MPQKSKLRDRMIRYGIAILTSAIAFAIALPLQRPTLELSPFIPFFAAVAVSSWYGGFGPGLVAVAIGTAATDFYLFEPHNSFLVNEPMGAATLALFLLVGVLISWLKSQLRGSEQRCTASADAARASENRVRRLSEANLIAVFFAEPGGPVRSGNDEFIRLTGCTREELHAGRVNWLTVTAPEHRALDAAAVDELVRARVCTPYEREHLLDDQRRIPVMIGCAMLDDSPDECVGFVLDLTERRRVEASLRQHQERLAAVSLELMVAEERERRRIAAVLHDSIGQSLALARLQLGAIAAAGVTDALGARLADIGQLLDGAIGQTRSLTSEVSPPVLYELGLEAAIRWLGGRLQEQHRISVQVRDDRQAKPLDPTLRFALFEAVRELLFNVAKHARAQACTISISRDGQTIRIIVQDDGDGFMPPSPDRGADQFGLSNLRERLDRLGGRAEIGRDPKRGTRATLVAPLARTINRSSGEDHG